VSDNAFRIADGGRIDRERPLRFNFNGRNFTGLAGDTLASALLANGVHLVGRSFKYHRPRGFLTDGSEEPNALVQLGVGAHTQPNVRATQAELYQGLIAESQNCWPSVNFDAGAVNDFISPVFPAGFYYEYFIRRMAGLGRAPMSPDPDYYDKTHAHCDVLVVGAGPAGLAAALAAARTSARVILVDEQLEPGGYLLGRNVAINDRPAMEWVENTVAELEAMVEVRVLTRTTALAYFDHNYVTLLERVRDHLGSEANGDCPRQRLWKVRAKQVVLAAGSHERPLVFRNNDRPGVMLASAAQAYVNRFAVRPGREAVVFTNNDSAYPAASDLVKGGIQCTIVDARPEPPEELRTAVRKQNIEVLPGHGVISAAGSKRVTGVDVATLNPAASGYQDSPRHLKCDLLLMSGGWNPAVHLFSQSRGKLEFDPSRACFVPGESVQAERSAGACNGTFNLAFCLSEGREAGKAAAAAAGFRSKSSSSSPKAESSPETPIRAVWRMPPKDPRGLYNKHFVDFQNDVTAADVDLAYREGYRSVEHLKRYTTMGMGTDQGKTSNINALAILAEISNADIPTVGTTTFRPPYTPATFGALAGRDVGELADPVRMTPMHQWHVAQGARFEDVGQWKRPWYYPKRDENMEDALARECKAARNAVGILDASTLGKIDIQGADAAEFLNRVYTNGWSKLAVGRCRYGLMCTEDGMVFDDGVTSRIAENHFLMTTTSGNAARVLAWLEEWLQTEWPELRVYCNSVTEHWATASIAGPLARKLLSELTDDIDLDSRAFPFMSWREGTVAGIRARVMRISFTGELSFEINVQSSYGLAIWTTLMSAGAKYGITPFGTETMHILRAEKGFIIAGQETDGTVTPVDLGLEGMVSKHKDFLGKRSLSRPDTLRDDRKQLVGLLTEDPHQVLPEGGQIVAELKSKPPMKMIGHVTSSYFSANLNHSIALALVKGGRSRHGETVHVPLEKKVLSARIVPPQFYDVDGERMRD
jgi:sarcosine oxidase subunit alpha